MIVFTNHNQIILILTKVKVLRNLQQREKADGSH